MGRVSEAGNGPPARAGRKAGKRTKPRRAQGRPGHVIGDPVVEVEQEWGNYNRATMEKIMSRYTIPQNTLSAF